jgi:hypothetical protein
MRTVLSALCLSILSAGSAFAQCYGDAAEAFGCGVSRSNEAALESFGESGNEVLPNYHGNSRTISASELFSHEETLNYYRRLYRGYRGNNWSEAAFRNSMNSQAQPLRRFRNTPPTGPRF